jgi:hypothetical protein
MLLTGEPDRSPEFRKQVWRIGLRIFYVLVAVALACAAVPIVEPILYMSFPEWFGNHPQFYRTCKSLREGSTLAEARAHMKGYLEVGRSYTPPSSVPQVLFRAEIIGKSEAPKEHDERILFIPDQSNVFDWCIVYPEKGRVRRVDISPD